MQCLLSPLKAHLLRILPWDRTGAENIGAALLFAAMGDTCENTNILRNVLLPADEFPSKDFIVIGQ